MKKDWSKKEDDFIIMHYANTSTSKLVYCLQRSLSSVYGRAKKLNLEKSEAYLNGPTSGRIQKGKMLSASTTFKPGHKPFNKGMKLHEFMNEEKINKVLQSSFKKGHKPVNTKQDGCISIRKDKNGRNYKWIRLSRNNWQMLHVHTWIKNNGAVPEGMIITFIDGNSMNTELSNLRLASNSEHMRNQHYKDGCIINYLSRKNPALKEKIKQYPALIELKRTQLQLKQQLENGNK